MQMDLVRDPEPAQPMILDAAMRGSADDPMCLIALQQQKLRQMGAVLAADSRHSRTNRQEMRRDKEIIAKK